MISEPRTISRNVELLHIPIQHEPQVLRDIYVEVSRSCGYENFIRARDGARLECAGGEGRGLSRVVFMKDRITFQEEQGDTSLEHLLRRIEEVVNTATDRISLPLFVCRNVTQRAIASVTQGKHSAQFLAENLFQLTPDHLGPLGRPAHLLGVRLHCPPPDIKEGSHQIRIESYLRDPRALFVEDVASFKMPVQSRDHARIATELREVEKFLNEQVHAFLSQFPG
ncbi:MAG: hypothetical protein ACE5GW_08005 [Planctomycetota bacterium]